MQPMSSRAAFSASGYDAQSDLLRRRRCQRHRLWSEYFDWPIDRIYALQDRIADQVAASLETKVRGLGALPRQPPQTRNTDAYLGLLERRVAAWPFDRRRNRRRRRAIRTRGKARSELRPGHWSRCTMRACKARTCAGTIWSRFARRYQPLLDKALQIEPELRPGAFCNGNVVEPAFARAKGTLFRRGVEPIPVTAAD